MDAFLLFPITGHFRLADDGKMRHGLLHDSTMVKIIRYDYP
jgi:hypothetical protein